MAHGRSAATDFYNLIRTSTLFGKAAASTPTRTVKLARVTQTTTPAAPSSAPGFLQPGKIACEVQLENNTLIRAEVSGTVNLGTVSKKVSAVADSSASPPNTTDAADFLLSVTYDPPTKRLEEKAYFRAAPGNTDGLSQFDSPPIGSFLVLAPLLSSIPFGKSPANSDGTEAVVKLAIAAGLGAQRSSYDSGRNARVKLPAS